MLAAEYHEHFVKYMDSGSYTFVHEHYVRVKVVY